jgi:8-oxo-dGTP diphosphatase
MKMNPSQKSAVVGILFSENRQKVLILKRRDVPVWVFPGGGVDPGESPEAAIVREILEETGLHAEVQRKSGEYTPINRLALLTHVFECSSKNGKLSTGSETKELYFCDVKNLPENFFIIHRVWLEDALLNKAEVIRRPITEVTYSRLFLYFCQHPLQVVRLLMSRLGLPINTK